MADNEISEKKYTFSQKVWIAVSITALVAVLLFLFKAIFDILLLILAATLISVFFRGLSSFIEKKTKWNSTVTLLISVIGTLAIIVLLFWLIGEKIQTQITQLSETFPTTIQNAKEELNKTAIGRKVMEKVTSPESMEKARAIAATFFSSTFGILGDIYVIFFLGIFFTVSPKLYKEGIVQLVPGGEKEKANDVLNKIGDSLKKWLQGKLFAMLVVFILTGIGLLIIGVPMWLVLAIIAGLFNFIPNFGPLIAMVPAVLVAWLQGPETALWVAGLYIFVQMVESNFITPTVQKKLVSVAPALIIIAQLIVGTLSGIWGIILATPFMVIIMVVVQELYTKRVE